MKILPALNKSLAALTVEPTDQATVELARQYARMLDAGVDVWHVGPRLLDILIEFGMTPKARNAIVKGGTPANGDSDPIDELASRRERRAANLD